MLHAKVGTNKALVLLMQEKLAVCKVNKCVNEGV